MAIIAADNGCNRALEAADDIFKLADSIAPQHPQVAENLRARAANIRDTVEEFFRLREAVWPGLPKFEPTPEKPQEDFYIAVAESLRDCFKQHAQREKELNDGITSLKKSIEHLVRERDGLLATLRETLLYAMPSDVSGRRAVDAAHALVAKYDAPDGEGNPLDTECPHCGGGYVLPSGRCDHCNLRPNEPGY